MSNNLLVLNHTCHFPILNSLQEGGGERERRGGEGRKEGESWLTQQSRWNKVRTAHDLQQDNDKQLWAGSMNSTGEGLMVATHPPEVP